MIPVLYKANATDFTTYGIGVLKDCTSCEVTEERNGAFECVLKYPITGAMYKEITLERLVKAKPNDTANDQVFRIYRVTTPINGQITIYDQHLSYDLSNIAALQWTTESISPALAMERVSLCDTVTIRHSLLGITSKAKVITTKYDTLAEKYISIELGSSKANLLNNVSAAESAAEDAASKVDRFPVLMNSAIKNATGLITGQTGGYVVTQSSTSFSYSNMELCSLDANSSYDFQVYIRDQLNTLSSTTLHFTVPQGTPLLALRKKMVGINTPTPEAALHVVGDTKIEGDAAISGDVVINGTLTPGDIDYDFEKPYFGTCATEAATAAKVVECSGFVLRKGALIAVQFTYANTGSSPSMNVNGTGAKAICGISGTYISTNMWVANQVVHFVYNGTWWIALNCLPANTSRYGITKLSSSVTSTSTVLAANAYAVKLAYDRNSWTSISLTNALAIAYGGTGATTAAAARTNLGISCTSLYNGTLTTGYYRVRKTWKDSKSQVGAYRVLSNAKAAADKNPGTYVFTNDGVAIYPTTTAETYRIHTVVKGDTLWDIAQKYLGSGTRYTEIVKLNGLTSNVIYSGMKLKIPN